MVDQNVGVDSEVVSVVVKTSILFTHVDDVVDQYLIADGDCTDLHDVDLDAVDLDVNIEARCNMVLCQAKEVKLEEWVSNMAQHKLFARVIQ